MSFNYVLLSKSLTKVQDEIVGLYKNRIDAIMKVNSKINQLFTDNDKKTVDQKLTGDDYYFNHTSRYYLVYQNDNGDLATEPITWGELAIQGKNGQKYLDSLNDHIKQMIAERAKAEQENNIAVKSLLFSHKLPPSYYDDLYCWCVIDLEKYQEILQADSDEIEDAGEYADQAWTMLRGNQISALDAVTKMQGKYAILVGKTKYVEDKWGDTGKPKSAYFYPLDDNAVYAITDDGISMLEQDCEKNYALNDLANWCFDALESNQLPEQLKEKTCKAIIRNAMFPFRIAKKDDKDIPLMAKILDSNSINDKDMFLDYFA